MEPTAPRWDELKSHTYANRDQFVAGVKRFEEKIATQAADATTRRAATTGTPNTADSRNMDSAMKELEEARSNLKAMAKEAGDATEANWSEKQEKVGKAWERTQKAYDKVSAGTTGRAQSGG